MIVYELLCENNHKFEGWFPSRAAFDEQMQSGLVFCPHCDSKKIKKVPRAFFPRNRGQVQFQLKKGDMEDSKMEILRKKVYDFVMKNTEDVGENFTEEAMKIHYGLVPERNIRGTVSQAQERFLRDEGISFFKIPVFQEKKKDTLN